ncbi:hypothetical protein OC835_000707 [Tilletia horrida]|nr:hypothetical protein OC835_000707 [Tilletia horrida]
MTTRSTFSTRSRRTAAGDLIVNDNDVQFFLLQTAVLLAKQQLGTSLLPQSTGASTGSGHAAGAAAGAAGAGPSGSTALVPSGAGGAAASGSTSAALAAAAAAAKRAQEGGGSKVDSWVSNVSGGISALSLSGLLSLSSSGGGSVRFPEKLLKRLNERLQLISFAKDPSYTSLRFRATVGAFYGQLNDKAFMTRMRSDRKIEDLIIAFVTTAQKRLSAASETMSPDERTAELESQVGSFVKVIRECLRQLHGVSKELTDRLEKYSAAFSGAPIVLSGSGAANTPGPRDTASIGSASGMATSSALAAGPQSPSLTNSSVNTGDYTGPSASTAATSNDSRRTSTAASLGGPTYVYSDPTLNALMDHPLINTVGSLFKEDKEQLRKDVDYMRSACTEEAYMIDLKHCVRAIHLSEAWPGRRADFPSAASTTAAAHASTSNASAAYPPFDPAEAERMGDDDYAKWRAQELADLSKTMAEMCSRNPSLLKVNSKEPVAGISADGRAAGELERVDSAEGAGNGVGANATGDDDDAAAAGFTFIPPDPRAYYRKALDIMLAHDIDAIMSFSEEEVSVGILSQSNLVLLDHIARCWRITDGWRRAVRLEVIRERYEAGQCPLDSVDDAVRLIVAPALAAAAATAASGDPSSPSAASPASLTDGWMIHERRLLSHTFGHLFRSLMRWLYDAFQDPMGADVHEVVAHAALVQEIHASGFLLESADPNLRPPSPTKPFANVPSSAARNGAAAALAAARSAGLPPHLLPVDLERHIEELRDAVRITAIHEYTARTTELFGQILPDDSNEIAPLLELRDWLETGAKRLSKRWGAADLPFDSIDVVSLVLEKQVPLYLDDLDSMRRQIVDRANTRRPDERAGIEFDELFLLFKKVRSLFGLFSAFCPEQMLRGAEEAEGYEDDERPEGSREDDRPRLTGKLDKDAKLLAERGRLGSFNLAKWFEPHMWRWLEQTELKVNEWVSNALTSDRFEPIDPSIGAVHSSSIDILFNALQEPVDFVLSLDWPDILMNARFLNRLAKIVSRAVERYCARVEELFKEEIKVSATAVGTAGADGDGGDGGAPVSKQSAWMAKAKLTLQGANKTIEPFHFQSTSCIKLNNIEAARRLLDKLYSKMDADEQARIVARAAPPDVPEKPNAQSNGQQRFLFTVKIVLGEGLSSASSSGGSSGSSGSGAVLDSFVTLSDQSGMTVAKTRTIYESADPRWDETVDIPVEANMWLAATVWHRKLMSEPQLCGQTYLRLDPRLFGDFLPHELWLELNTRGRLLIRVSMEGEKDDILFHFGRAFRILKRAESDMIRSIVDKMSVYIRQSLSRQVLKSLVKTSGITLDKALGNVKALYASALASTQTNAPLIPPVNPEGDDAGGSSRIKKGNQLTDHEIEAPLLPLLDYLDECLSTLKDNLSEAEAQLVLKKVWKEVLKIIEDILVPPLSDTPAVLQPLSDKEVDIVFKWLGFLKSYFNARDEETGEEHGVPLEVLQGPKYREIISYSLFHDMGTDQLLAEIRRLVQQRDRAQMANTGATAGGTRMATRKKSVYNQRNLKTIRQRKREKVEKAEQPGSLELLLRLLRMRPGAGDYLPEMYRFAGVTGAGAREDKYGKPTGPGKYGGLAGPGGRRPVPSPTQGVGGSGSRPGSGMGAPMPASSRPGSSTGFGPGPGPGPGQGMGMNIGMARNRNSYQGGYHAGQHPNAPLPPPQQQQQQQQQQHYQQPPQAFYQQQQQPLPPPPQYGQHPQPPYQQPPHGGYR